MKTRMHWQGVMPAITTPFNEDLSIDHAVPRIACQLADR